MRAKFIAVSCIPLVVPTTSNATVTLYYNSLNHAATKQAWLNAAGTPTKIDFSGFAQNTIITTQYLPLGVDFVDGTDRIHYTSSFVEDGVGINGAFDESRLVFTQPMRTLAFDYPGNIQFTLISNGQTIYTSAIIFGGGVGAFVGVISDQAFDTVQIVDPTGDLFYDNLYFGATVPAPGAWLALMLGGAATGIARRRRG